MRSIFSTLFRLTGSLVFLALSLPIVAIGTLAGVMLVSAIALLLGAIVALGVVALGTFTLAGSAKAGESLAEFAASVREATHKATTRAA